MPPSRPMSKHTAEYVTLRDYIDSRFVAAEKATESARVQMEKRLDGMNEFRDTLRDQGITFITKSEYSVFKEAIIQDIRSLRETRATLEGKASQTSFIITLLIAVAGLIISIVR